MIWNTVGSACSRSCESTWSFISTIDCEDVILEKIPSAVPLRWSHSPAIVAAAVLNGLWQLKQQSEP